MATTKPDIFTNVHRGIRNALFEACLMLGRAGTDTARIAAARVRLRDALHFVAHHGENEDVLLLPLLVSRAPGVFERMRSGHTEISQLLDALSADADVVAIPDLHHRACAFVALYLEHMRQEEQELDPQIRGVLAEEELLDFGRRSVERTAPADQRLMLGWMIPAMPPEEASALVSKLPATIAADLRPLIAR